MRPFLRGAPRPKILHAGSSSTEPIIDVVTIVEKIRGLKYRSLEDYIADLETLQRQTIEMSVGEDATLVESVKTLVSNGELRWGVGLGSSSSSSSSSSSRPQKEWQVRPLTVTLSWVNLEEEGGSALGIHIIIILIILLTPQVPL